MEVEVDDDGIRVCFKIDDEKGTPLLVAMNLVPDNAVLQGRTNTMLFSFTNNPIPMPMPPLLILNNLPQTLFCSASPRLRHHLFPAPADRLRPCSFQISALLILLCVTEEVLLLLTSHYEMTNY